MAKPHPSELLVSLSSAVPTETFIDLLSKALYPALDSIPAAQRSDIISIMAPCYPYKLLASLSSNVPAETFFKSISKGLYPALGALPDAQQSNIVSILETTMKAEVERAAWIELVGYERITKSLRLQVAELNKDVRNNWKNGYDGQADMMCTIASDIQRWLSTLWIVGVEEGVERPLVQKGLKFCHSITTQVEQCGSRTEFSEVLENGYTVIKDKAGTEVYSGGYGGLDRALAWLWRELLLSRLSVDNKGNAQAKKIIDYIDTLKLLGVVKELLRQGDIDRSVMTRFSHPADTVLCQTETSSGTFHDEHWSRSTRKAARRLKKSLASYEC